MYKNKIISALLLTIISISITQTDDLFKFQDIQESGAKKNSPEAKQREKEQNDKIQKFKNEKVKPVLEKHHQEHVKTVVQKLPDYVKSKQESKKNKDTDIINRNNLKKDFKELNELAYQILFNIKELLREERLQLLEELKSEIK